MSMPKEPRQLMINLMYLVLTAMLALNVSSEILHAFRTINQSINQSNSSIEAKNQELYEQFDQNEQMPGREARVKPYNDKAKEIRAAADEVYDFLESWKDTLVSTAGGYGENGEIKKESDIDAATRLLVNGGGGDQVKEKLLDLKAKMLAAIENESQRKNLEASLPLRIEDPKPSDNNPQGSWSAGNFFNMPVMAAITLFSKMQNDVRNAEALIVKQLFDDAYSSSLRFDEIAAIAVPKTSYALVGQKVEAQIMLAAYNRTALPEVKVSSGRIEKVENGVAYWVAEASGVGQQTVRGKVSIDLGDNPVEKDWEFQYMVGSAGGSIQLDKMNVFYIGVDNPVTVSAAGYSLEDVYLQMPDAEIKQDAGRGKGTYNIRVTKPSSPDGVKVAIMARTQGGGAKEVGALSVRVKYIPDPVAQVAGQAGGYISAAKFRPQIGPAAVLQHFEFDARYILTEFAYTVMKRRDPDLKGPHKVVNPNGAVFRGNPDIMRLQDDLKPGDRVFIDDIKARGPDGRVRSLNSLSFTLN